MPSMTKRVNVYAQVAIRNIKPPIYGTRKDIIMTTGDILKCLCKRARVEEILHDGSTVRLNMKNYYLDNGAGLDATKQFPKKEEANKNPDENPARFKVPVAPRAQVVETKTEIDMKQTVTGATSAEIAPEENTAESVSEAEDTTDIPVGTSGYIQVLDDTCSDDDNSGVETTITTTATITNINHNNHHKKKNKHK